MAAPAANRADRHQAQPRLRSSMARPLICLPCLGRIEIDRQATGVQFVTVEDTTGRFHASHGQVEPASEHLLSEPRSSRSWRRRPCRPIPSSTGTRGRRLRARARRHRGVLSGDLLELQRAHQRIRGVSTGRCRRASASGQRRTARPISSRRAACRKIRICRSCAKAC